MSLSYKNKIKGKQTNKQIVCKIKWSNLIFSIRIRKKRKDKRITILLN